MLLYGLPTRQPVAREIQNLQTSTQPARIFSHLEYTRFIPVPWLPPGGRTHRKEPDVCATQRYFLGQVAGLSMLGFATSIALAVGDMTNTDQQTPTVWLRLLVLECIQERTAGVRIMFQTGEKGRLTRNHEEYQFHLTLARRSVERAHPVGVRVDKEKKRIWFVWRLPWPMHEDVMLVEEDVGATGTKERLP